MSKAECDDVSGLTATGRLPGSRRPFESLCSGCLSETTLTAAMSFMGTVRLNRLERGRKVS